MHRVPLDVHLNRFHQKPLWCFGAELYGTGKPLGFFFTPFVVGCRVLVFSSGWLASYVGQSVVPASITQVFLISFSSDFDFYKTCMHF